MRGQACGLTTPAAWRTRAQNAPLLGDRGRRVPVGRTAHEGAQPRGSGGVPPPAWERPRRGGDRASEARRGAMDAPLWGAIYAGRRGAAPAHETFRSLVC